MVINKTSVQILKFGSSIKAIRDDRAQRQLRLSYSKTWKLGHFQSNQAHQRWKMGFQMAQGQNDALQFAHKITQNWLSN